ncbi:MAG: NADPH-dependent FMN reductase, partial [Candidatus Binatia bacterium]
RVGAGLAEEAGAEVTLIDLRDFPLPLYDGDFESAQGIPPKAMELKALFLKHHGLLISTPEYNSSITGVLKNSIDWVSRSAPGEESLACFKEKYAGLLSASPGSLGGLRSLVHFRGLLQNIGVHVVPHQFALSRAHEAFDENGKLKDAKQEASVRKVVDRLTHILRKVQL